MLQPGRQYSPSSGSGLYRYGFNGKEKSDEIYGEANFYDYGMRGYDPRVGRFWGVDPLSKSYPWYSSYQFAGNKPIEAIDLNGTEEFYINQQSRVKYRTELELSIKKEQNEKRVNPFSSSLPINTYSTGSQATISQNLTPYNTEYKQELRNEEQTIKNLKGATMDPWAGEVSMMTYGTAQAYIHGVVDHFKGAIEGLRNGNYLGAAGSVLLFGLDIAPFVKVPIKTPYSLAYQSTTSEALSVARSLHGGSTLYKIGTLGNSETFASQFWSTENPLELGIENFAKKYGIPETNLKGDLFVQAGKLQANSGFVTREAKDLSGNLTGGIEVVTNPGTVTLETFSTIKH